MKDSLEDKHFEEQWKKAFHSRELVPSENVWKGVDAHLANKQAGTYRRTAFFYRWVAAASVVILLSWTGYYLYKSYNNEGTESFAQSTEEALIPETSEGPELLITKEDQNKAAEPSINSQSTELTPSISDNSETLIADEENNRADPSIEKNSASTDPKLNNGFEQLIAEKDSEITTEALDDKNPGSSDPDITSDVTIAVIGANTSEKNEIIVNESDHPIILSEDETALALAEANEAEEKESSRETISLVENDLITSNNFPGHDKSLGFDIIETGLPELEIEPIPTWDFELSEEHIKDPEGLWAGLNFSPGIFDPNFSNSAVAAENLSAASFDVPVSPTVTDSEVTQGFSYGFGVNAGLPLGKKWVIQSGLEYSVSNSETSTSLIVESPAGDRSVLTFTNSDAAESSFNSVSISSPTGVNSSYQFLSVPVKAGYALLNKKKFGLLVSGGVSTDIFLSNKISSSQPGVNSFTQSAGSDSPFRTVYFSGLTSLTLSYKLSKSYLILLEPSYKGALNSFSKSSELFKSRPNSFGVGVGIRYKFK